MLIADIRPHLSNKFSVVHSEFIVMCGSNLQAANLLSNLFWWSQVNDAQPERKGWLYKTAADLKEELGLTRRGYEKARKGLLELGVLQYRRGGVHGKMHWLLNREKLLEKCYQARGLKLPKGFSSQFIIDRDNFRLDNWVPLDLWHAFLDMRIDTGNKVSIKGKKTLLKQLKTIHDKGLDIRPVMENAIASGCYGFLLSDLNKSLPSSQANQKQTEEKLRREYEEIIQAQQQALTEKKNKPPPSKPDKEPSENHKAALKAAGIIPKSAQ
ncbi:hypothetical protein [Neisseria wadsworthii]|uniref:hypothetical protein n=1 Tax=Neisseria wadsworthii TaxID=607711 RepID=UPI000D2F51ED|nr:hypothetical protein [Neisseria wadsworthii]